MSTPIRRAIYGKMAGDTTLNSLLGIPAAGRSKAIYYGVAPDDADYPFVLFNKQAGTPSYALVATPAYETDVWMIKAVDESPTADAAEAVATRLSVLLNDGVLSISGATQLYLRRQSDIDFPETEESQLFWHVGGLYRLLYQ